MTQVPLFSSRFVDGLPGEREGDNQPREVLSSLWSKVVPTPVSAPKLLAFSKEVVAMLGLTEVQVTSPDFVSILAGNSPAPGTTPFAANYGGHQFGHWAGQLGDGRAIGLGELAGLELQLKGAGPTPYSRRGDGRAVLRSSIREFLCSEAMHHLGVPTTRALSLVLTGEQVVRDMFYDGHPELEPGAIVCRVAPSFLRFGNFELCTAREDLALLRQLADFTLTHYFPELAGEGTLSERSGRLLIEVAERTAKLVAAWQSVGFVHGVMNTDNMSMLGLTIDYGPYGWVDDFNPSWTPNTTDAQHHRYCYGRQAGIGLWNIERLAVALSPLFEGDEAQIEAALGAYERTFEKEASARFAAKLGLRPSAETTALVHGLFSWLSSEETDMTVFFRGLSTVIETTRPTAFPDILKQAFYGIPSRKHVEAGLQWLSSWWEHTRNEGPSPTELAQHMRAVNPKYVLRNYLTQQAIDSAHQGDYSEVTTLLEVMRKPYDEQPHFERYAQKRPDWARSKPGCSALSCSS